MQSTSPVESYKPAPMVISQEEIDHITDPIGRLLVDDYIRRGWWKLVE